MFIAWSIRPQYNVCNRIILDTERKKKSFGGFRIKENLKILKIGGASVQTNLD